MTFPDSISLTITNHCNLRCKMCGQWSEEGYVVCNKEKMKNEMTLEEWKRVIDEIADHGVDTILLRGGETFMFPGIIELLDYAHAKGFFISIDTNGTMLGQYAEDIVRIGNMHLTVSIDGPEDIHDKVRGVSGTYQRVKDGLERLTQLELQNTNKISRSICFTISRYNYKYLGEMPDVARSLGIDTISIVPYYYFSESIGQQYAEELANLGCRAFSWRGFHHEESGVELHEFEKQLRYYHKRLRGVQDYPYMGLSNDEYRIWFTDGNSPVGPHNCLNVEKLIDVQPDGSVNFCVDFIDYSFGNVREATIEQLWNGENAERFRIYRRDRALAVCSRCGAKFMSRPWSAYTE